MKWNWKVLFLIINFNNWRSILHLNTALLYCFSLPIFIGSLAQHTRLKSVNIRSLYNVPNTSSHIFTWTHLEVQPLLNPFRASDTLSSVIYVDTQALFKYPTKEGLIPSLSNNFLIFTKVISLFYRCVPFAYAITNHLICFSINWMQYLSHHIKNGFSNMLSIYSRIILTSRIPHPCDASRHSPRWSRDLLPFFPRHAGAHPSTWQPSIPSLFPHVHSLHLPSAASNTMPVTSHHIVATIYNTTPW